MQTYNIYTIYIYIYSYIFHPLLFHLYSSTILLVGNIYNYIGCHGYCTTCHNAGTLVSLNALAANCRCLSDNNGIYVHGGRYCKCNIDQGYYETLSSESLELCLGNSYIYIIYIYINRMRYEM